MARLIKTDLARQPFIYAPPRQNECQLPVEIISGRLFSPARLSARGATINRASAAAEPGTTRGFHAAA